MHWRRFTALAATIALAGCAGSQADRPQSAAAGLADRSIQVRTAAGQLSTLRLARDGIVSASFDGREVAGRWALADDQLCFTWSGNFRECWPYAEPLRRGDTRAITSSRGNKVTVTLQ